jgi:hypothetical protein
MFMFKSVILACLMFISVLSGMQLANDGIHKMKGFEDPDFKSAMDVKENSDGQLNASLLGQDVTSHDIEAKKQQLEELKAYNFFSSMGKNISEGISSGTRALIDKISRKND